MARGAILKHRIISTLFVLIGLVNLYPVVGMLSPDQLTNLYGLEFAEANLQILMRHRALLLGLLGLLLLLAAVRPIYQPLAFIAGFASMLSFVLIAFTTGDNNPYVEKVAQIDIVASLLLFVALIVYLQDIRGLPADDL